MTIAIAIAVTLHAVPLLLADPELDPAVQVDEWTCCFGCGGVIADPLEDLDAPATAYMRLDGPADHRLSREQAIEQARIGGIGSITHRDEIYLDELDCAWCYWPVWKVRTSPQLSASMRPVAPSGLSIYPIQLAGGLDKPTVRRHLKRKLSTFARCQALATPTLALRGETGGLGEVFNQILIGRDGRVVHVIVRDERDEVVDCVTRAFEAIEFPRSPNGELTQVNVPLHYGTTDASAGALVR